MLAAIADREQTVVTDATSAAPGWYPTATGSAQLRWWDGTKWTEHTYDPPVAPAAPVYSGTVLQAPRLTAPQGVTPGTPWFWIIAAGSPALQMLLLIPTSIWLGSFTDIDITNPNAVLAAEFNPSYFVLILLEFALYALNIVFAALDWRALKARGVPQPFSWGWSFFVLATGMPIVYVIGRSVVARRRTGRGLAPLWVFVGLEVLALLVGVIVGILFAVQLINQFSGLLQNAGDVI
jgi:hypothetical protein